jgi:Spy/CpxP family protein refolding chaperone
MKTRISRTLVALAAAGLIGSATLWTAAVAGDKWEHGGERHSMRHGPGATLGMGPMRGLMRDLDLSEEQRARIGDIIKNAWEQGAAERQALQGIRAKVEEAVAAEGFDEARVRGIIESGMPPLTESFVRMARTMAEVRTVLTPEQREKLDARRAELREQREERARERDAG